MFYCVWLRYKAEILKCHFSFSSLFLLFESAVFLEQFNDKRFTSLNGHMSNRDSTLTSFREGGQLIFACRQAHHRINNFNNGRVKLHYYTLMKKQSMCCMWINIIPTPNPVIKFTILVDPSFVIITTHLVCLIYGQQQRR